jgi:hypothetical protein
MAADNTWSVSRMSSLMRLPAGGTILLLACKRCGAKVKRGAKQCRVCGVSRPGSLVRVSIIWSTALGLSWLVLLIVAYRLW